MIPFFLVLFLPELFVTEHILMSNNTLLFRIPFSVSCEWTHSSDLYAILKRGWTDSPVNTSLAVELRPMLLYHAAHEAKRTNPLVNSDWFIGLAPFSFVWSFAKWMMSLVLDWILPFVVPFCLVATSDLGVDREPCSMLLSGFRLPFSHLPWLTFIIPCFVCIVNPFLIFF